MADNEIPLLVTADSSQAKEQLEKAGDSVQMLADLIGVSVPAGVGKMLASCELIAPALDAAFAPLAIISLGMALIDVTDKVSKFVADAVTGASSMSKFTDQIKSDNKVLEDLAQKTKAANRELALLNAPDQKSKNALKLQFQIEDQGGSAAQFEQQLKEKQRKLQKLMTDTTTVATDVGEGMVVFEQKLVSKTEEGKQQIAQLEEAIVILGAKQKEAAAAEALASKQNQDLLDQERAKTAALAAQKAAIAKQQSAARAAAAADMQRFFEEAQKRQNKILTAKQLEEKATKDQITAEQAIALSGLANVKVDEQRAQFGQKYAENSEKIAQLDRDITDKDAQHNAALQIALGYTTQAKADAQALATLERDKSAAITEANNRLTAQDAIVKQLGIDTMRGTLGSPEQQAAFQKATLDYQKLKIEQLNIEKKYDDQIAGLQLKLTNTFAAQFRKQLLSWQDINKELGQTFQSTLSGLNSALTSFVTTGKANWQQLASSAISEIVKIGLQYAESQLMMEIIGKTGAQTELQSKATAGLGQITIDAQVAMANAYAPLAASPPAAMLAAGAAGMAVRGFAAPVLAAAKFELGGIVPMDGLAYLHKNEKVIPASMSGTGFSGSGTGAGTTVIVNHSVQAVDAASFQQHIRTHSNMIANEVTRALKRKRA